MKQFLKYAGFTFVMFSATLAFTACDSNKAEETEEVAAVYACPMDCEKGKTYSEPGKCPVCEMDLQAVSQE